MSKNAKDFIEEVGRNAELRNEMFQKSSDVVLGLAKKHGFDFSKEELHDALREKLGAPVHPAADTESSNCVVVIIAAAARNK